MPPAAPRFLTFYYGVLLSRFTIGFLFLIPIIASDHILCQYNKLLSLQKRPLPNADPDTSKFKPNPSQNLILNPIVNPTVKCSEARSH